MPSSLQITVEIVFEADLPNGAYGETNGASTAKLYVPSGLTYGQVGTILTEQWIKSRGEMMNMHTPGGGRYKEDWWLASLDYKGGPVNPQLAAVEGNHSLRK